MALTRERILETALSLLSEYGLGDLSMRRVAGELGVAPGALYYHVKNKQELLTQLASKMLDPEPLLSPGGAEASQPEAMTERELIEAVVGQARAVRDSVLRFQDGADVIGIALAADPDSVSAFVSIRNCLEFGGVCERRADWGARSVLYTVLGFVSTAHNRIRLESPSAPTGERPVMASDDAEACDFGVSSIVLGIVEGSHTS
ncbi:MULTISPECIES: TetR family transcriptional regulator [Micrococcaceae]|uniref:TetR family transcriptional regulator n=1 Tax=unclassified Kocuria TaxID=2649579 RepID=UPI001010F513|nr:MULTISPECIES: TetR family transcriptional regulator [unclassified Kocuria]